MTIRTIRARLLRLLQRERAAWLEHEREAAEWGKCLASCEAAQRAARELLGQTLQAAGARVPRWADPALDWPDPRREPDLRREPVPVAAGPENDA